MVGGGVVGGGVVGGGVVGAGVVGGGLVGDAVSRPKKRTAWAASTGRLCETPCMLIASTVAVPPVPPYRVRV